MRTTGRETPSARSRWRSVATAVAAFLLLVVAWELVKVVVPADGVSIGGTRVLPRTSDAATSRRNAATAVATDRHRERADGVSRPVVRTPPPTARRGP